MKKYSTIWVSFLAWTLLFSTMTSVTSSNDGEVEDEREFDYMRGSEKGPEHWGELKKEWSLCKTGQMQSPIDLSHPVVEVIPAPGKIDMSYKVDQAVQKNRGHDIMVEWKGKVNEIKINETKYFLQQGHWHTPSEHTIDGQRFEGELHLVHQNEDKKIAVVSVLYSIGKPDPFLTQIIEKVKKIPNPLEEADVGLNDPKLIKMGRSGYYRYIGSLTTPPCTEGIIWTVNKEIATLSKEQIALLREAVADHVDQNSRPLQPLNERKVHLYNPHYVTLKA